MLLVHDRISSCLPPKKSVTSTPLLTCVIYHNWLASDCILYVSEISSEALIKNIIKLWIKADSIFKLHLVILYVFARMNLFMKIFIKKENDKNFQLWNVLQKKIHLQRVTDARRINANNVDEKSSSRLPFLLLFQILS